MKKAEELLNTLQSDNEIDEVSSGVIKSRDAVNKSIISKSPVIFKLLTELQKESRKGKGQSSKAFKLLDSGWAKIKDAMKVLDSLKEG